MRSAKRNCAGVDDASCGNELRTVGRGPVAELPPGIVAPASNRAGVHHHTVMKSAGRNGRGASHARHRHGRGAVGCGAVAELAINVVTPALNRAAAQHRASMEGASRRGVARRDASHRRWQRLIPQLGERCAIAEFAVGVAAPTLLGSITERRAGVSVAGSDRFYNR